MNLSDLIGRAKAVGLSAEVITAFAPAQLEEVVRKLEEKNDDNTE